MIASALITGVFAGCAGDSQSSVHDTIAGNGTVGSANQTASATNPGFTPVPLAVARDIAVGDLASRNAVQWTTEPVFQSGALVAAGTLGNGLRLSDPMNGEPSAFSLYYGDSTEVLAELLPEAGPMRVWNTDATVAPSEIQIKGDQFAIKSYSPLFMDVGSSDLVLRVWGYDATGNRLLLSIHTVGVE